ncbi:MAG TPA: zf-HC2 domain-containing protein [Acidobacteriota bacterium]|nr:zf-HC2 domain-containing protein [Acidobacteriota bacterium]
MARHCEEYIEDLSDYIDGEIDPELCAEIRKHLSQCTNCRIMVDTMKMTVSLCRDGKPEPLPPSLESKLNALLKQRWEKKFGRKP